MTAQLWITLVCAVIGSGGFTALVTYMLTSRREHKAKAAINVQQDKAMRDAVMMLVLSELQARCRSIIAAGRRTTVETKQLFKLRSIYKALGGDGWADELYNAAMETPLIEKEARNE
ncbi:MAG: hypothetical protein IJU05_04855 [Schwartzia sp.]|nr:hypothetical protein [Schwartzia sp. (in: firmicutes)]